MGFVKLEPRFPKNIDGLSLDPEPSWTLDSLISELNALELKLNATSTVSVPFTKTRFRELPCAMGVVQSSKTFVMRVSNDEIEDIESQDDEILEQSLVLGRRFSCAELYLSDSDGSEDNSSLEETQTHLMDKVGLLEGVLVELDHEHQVGVEEEVRNRIYAFEADLMNVNERVTHALIEVEKHMETRMEMDRKLDTQYQRKIAEALDNHLIAVQRDHEKRSQIEERKIRNDAAFEEAKRNEKALQEEKGRREKAKAENEARLEAAKKKAEEAQKAALEAERRAAKEAAEKDAIEATKRAAAEVAENTSTPLKTDANADEQKEKEKGNILKAATNALKLEEERLRKYKELDGKNQTLGLGSNKDFHKYELQIARRIKQISGTKENVRAKANELIKILNDPVVPQSILIAMFAKKVVSQCENPSATFGNTLFPYAHVIVLITSQIPLAMDLILAEFHRGCIYTVPKHIHYSKSVFKTKEAYFKAIGYQETDSTVESRDRYLEGIRSYMKLYGALVQTEVEGVQNLHGLKEGWAWIARFLNSLPANIYTAVALNAFLEVAGFSLCRNYKSQFKKILNIISRNFVDALNTQGDPELNSIILKINTYIETKQFLKEPEGRRLQASLLSSAIEPVTEPDSGFYQDLYYHQPNRYSYRY